MVKTNKEIGQELVKKYPRVALLVPTYKSVMSVFFQHFYTFVNHLSKCGFEHNLFFVDNTAVAKARNELVKHFLPANEMKEYDIVLWIDSDHTFGIGDFMRLLQDFDTHDEIEILSGRYITRDNNAPRVCGFNYHTDKEKFEALAPNDYGVVECDGFGFGFCIMKPSVLQNMWNEYGGHQFAFSCVGPKEEGDQIGEDLTWCQNAQKLGYKLYFDHDVKIGHYGGIIDDGFLMYKWSEMNK